MDEGELAYVSYLLRLRRVPDARGNIWRASLESPRSGQVHSFASLEEMLTFLMNITCSSSEHQTGPHAG
jgi:hypothetical protein